MNRATPTDDKHEFFAIGPNCWGRGRTRKAARANARANYPGWRKYKPSMIIVTVVPRGTVIDDFAQIHFRDHDPRQCAVCDLSELDAHNKKKEQSC